MHKWKDMWSKTESIYSPKKAMYKMMLRDNTLVKMCLLYPKTVAFHMNIHHYNKWETNVMRAVSMKDYSRTAQWWAPLI